MRLLSICLAALALLLCTESAKAQYYSPYVIPGQTLASTVPGYYTINGYGQSVWVPNPYYGTYATPVVPYYGVPEITSYYPYGYYRPYPYRRLLFGGRRYYR